MLLVERLELAPIYVSRLREGRHLHWRRLPLGPAAALHARDVISRRLQRDDQAAALFLLPVRLVLAVRRPLVSRVRGVRRPQRAVRGGLGDLEAREDDDRRPAVRRRLGRVVRDGLARLLAAAPRVRGRRRLVLDPVLDERAAADAAVDALGAAPLALLHLLLLAFPALVQRLPPLGPLDLLEGLAERLDAAARAAVAAEEALERARGLVLQGLAARLGLRDGRRRRAGGLELLDVRGGRVGGLHRVAGGRFGRGVSLRRRRRAARDLLHRARGRAQVTTRHDAHDGAGPLEDALEERLELGRLPQMLGQARRRDGVVVRRRVLRRGADGLGGLLVVRVDDSVRRPVAEVQRQNREPELPRRRVALAAHDVLERDAVEPRRPGPAPARAFDLDQADGLAFFAREFQFLAFIIDRIEMTSRAPI